MRFQPLLGCTGLLAVALLLLPIGGCSGGEEDADAGAARVRILTSDADGPIDGVVLLRGVVDGIEQDFEARPLASEPDIHVAPEAPPGTYYVTTSTGWGMLWAGTGGQGLPILRGGDFPATSVRLGRPRSLYVGASDPGAASGHVSPTWGAEWKVVSEGSSNAFEPAAIRVEPQGEGLVALRFSKEVWQAGHAIRVGGLFETGAATQLVTFVTSEDRVVALPRFAVVVAAPALPLDVYLLPSPGTESVADGRVVRVVSREVPLPVAYEAKSFKGHARFEGIGSLGHGLQVEVPDIGPEARYVMSQETWRTRGELYAIALDASALVRVQLDVGGAALTGARVRFRGTTRYGVVPLWQAGGLTYLATAPGAQRWLLRRADGALIEHAMDAPVAREGETPVEGVRGAARPPARVRGRVEDAGRGFRVNFTRLLASGERVTGAGFSAAVDLYGQYDASLPAGRYELRVERPGGALGRPRVLPRPLVPGGEVRIDLSTR